MNAHERCLAYIRAHIPELWDILRANPRWTVLQVYEAIGIWLREYGIELPVVRNIVQSHSTVIWNGVLNHLTGIVHRAQERQQAGISEPRSRTRRRAPEVVQAFTEQERRPRMLRANRPEVVSVDVETGRITNRRPANMLLLPRHPDVDVPARPKKTVKKVVPKKKPKFNASIGAVKRKIEI